MCRVSGDTRVTSAHQIYLELIGHACVTMNISGITLLTDPHIYPSYRNGYFTYFPPRSVKIDNLPSLDAILISHSHRDHFDVASLTVLPRGTPIFCPADARILNCLQSLDFEEVITVSDWSRLELSADISLLWTPSTYRVPEHGLAIRAGDLKIWNMVDTHVLPDWVAQVLEFLGGPPDILMISCQPLLETEIVEAEHPIAGYHGDVTPNDIISLSGARHVLPFADGHFCSGKATWLNHQKFPLSSEAIARILRAHSPSTSIIDAAPSDKILLRDGVVTVMKGAVEYVDRLTSAADRSFHPGGWIEPLLSERSVETCGLELQIRHIAAEPGLNIAAPLFQAFGTDLQLLETAYRLSILDGNGEAQHLVNFIVSNEGVLRIVEGDVRPDIEIAIAVDDAEDLSTGVLGFSAALLGGRIREFERLVPKPFNRLRISSIHDKPHRNVFSILTGICIINLILNTIPDLARIEIEREFNTDPPDFPNQRRCRDQDSLPTIHVAGLHSSSPTDGIGEQLWERLENTLQDCRDPANASFILDRADGPSLIMFPGRSCLDQLQCGRVGVKRGILIPICLLEAQPFLGNGVRFPINTFNAICEAILHSGITSWEVWRLTPSPSIPKWRWSSLFPFNGCDILRRLHHHGWQGDLFDINSVDRPPAWWLGVPQLKRTDDVCFWHLNILGRTVKGIISFGHIAGNRFIDDSVDFRLELTGKAEVLIVKILTEGRCRFSWLRTYHETEQMFGFTSGSDYELILERLFLHALTSVVRMNCGLET